MRAALYPEGRMRIELVGKDAADAGRGGAGSACRPRTRVLVAPFPLVVPEEPLAREKLFPLLGLVRVPDARRGIDAARGDAADRRRRALGRDPLARPADGDGLRRGACRCCAWPSTSAAAPARPGIDTQPRARP